MRSIKSPVFVAPGLCGRAEWRTNQIPRNGSSRLDLADQVLSLDVIGGPRILLFGLVEQAFGPFGGIDEEKVLCVSAVLVALFDRQPQRCFRFEGRCGGLLGHEPQTEPLSQTCPSACR